MSTRRPRPAGERVYRCLLHLYPSDFRAHYGEMMVDFYRERMLETGAVHQRAWRAVRIYGDVAMHGVLERLAPMHSRFPVDESSTTRSTGERQMLSNLRQDLHYALRNLRRTPAFTTTVLLTLALGIGANVAIFSVVSGVLLHPLPFADAERVIQLAHSNEDAPSMLSEAEVVDLARDARSFSRLGAYAYADGNVTGGGDADRVRIARASSGFFHTLSPVPQLGRAYNADEDRAGAPDVVVISYGLWQRRYAMDSSVVGRPIVLNGIPRIVVGVMPPHFDFPAANVDIWAPLRLDREAMVTRSNHYLRVVARLAPGVTITRAHAEVQALRDQWARDFPQSYSHTDPLQVDVKPIRDRIVGAAEPYLIALLGAVGFVLLIACANVANLMLARGEVRRKEMTIRSALGATRARIARQLALESGVLTLGGGVLGIATAWPVLRVIVATAPGSIPRVGEVGLDTNALLFAATLCILTGILFSLLPIVRASNITALGALSRDSRNASHAGGVGARRARAGLVISEVALAVMMLAGAGVFLRTLVDLRNTTLGFATQGVVTARLSLPSSAYKGAQGAAFIATLIERTREVPGVTSSAAMAWTPIIEGGGNWPIDAANATSTTGDDVPTAEPQQITPSFFATLSIPVLRGREFTDADRATSEPVVIINESLAKRLWQSSDVLGRRIRLHSKDSPWMTVVGVVADTRVDGVTEAMPPVMYFPHQQAGTTGYFTSLSMTLLVRTTTGVAGVVPAIKRTVRELDPNVPLSRIQSMDEIVGSSVARHRFTTMLLTGLAAFAAALAAIGIYGVIAYSVAQRRYEFGVRMALGAGRGRVLALVLREGLGVAAFGLVVGVIGAVLLGRVLAASLASVGAVDVPVLAGVSVLLLVVALLALVLPARRAANVEPTEALRHG